MQSKEDFKSIEELYNRVLPALYSKCKEIKNAGYKLVSEKDIWDYLVENEWKKRSDLELADLVNDILYVNNYAIYEAVVEKMKNLKRETDKKEDNVL